MGIKKTKLEDFQLIIYFSLTQCYVTSMVATAIGV